MTIVGIDRYCNHDDASRIPLRYALFLFLPIFLPFVHSCSLLSIVCRIALGSRILLSPPFLLVCLHQSEDGDALAIHMISGLRSTAGNAYAHVYSVKPILGSDCQRPFCHYCSNSMSFTLCDVTDPRSSVCAEKGSFALFGQDLKI